MDVLFFIPVLISIVILTSHLLDEVPHLRGSGPSWDLLSPGW